MALFLIAGLVSGFLASYAIYQPQIQDLETQLQEQQKQNENLKTQIGNLENQVSNLQTENTEIKTQLTEYKRENENLKTQLNRYQIENESLKQEINTLKERKFKIIPIPPYDIESEGRKEQFEKMAITQMKIEYQKLKEKGLTESEIFNQLVMLHPDHPEWRKWLEQNWDAIKN
jgi:chromosome segregation ATPase